MTNNPKIDGVSREPEVFLCTFEIIKQMPVDTCHILGAPVTASSFVDREVVLLDAHRQRVAALQSTIARLEARVAELESGRGEPIYEQRYGGGWINIGREEYERCLADPEEASSLRIVFTTPAAPAAAPTDLLRRLAYALSQVGKPDHLVDYDAVILAREDLNACLDATAALNGVKS